MDKPDHIQVLIGCAVHGSSTAKRGVGRQTGWDFLAASAGQSRNEQDLTDKFKESRVIPMLEPILELSPDLEWMLQSGQASHAMLVEALINEFYGPVYRLALSILDDQAAAEAASLQTFTTAPLSIYRYRSQVGARTWLFGLALEAIRQEQRRITARQTRPVDFEYSHLQSHVDLWRAVDTLAEPARITVLVRYLLGWPPAQIARLLQVKEAKILSTLAEARSLARQAFLQASENRDGQEDEILDLRMAGALQERWPAPDLAPSDLERLISQADSLVTEKGARRRKFNYLKEAAWVGLIISLGLGILWGANTLLPAPAPTVAPYPAGAQIAASGPSRTLTPRGGESLALERQPDETSMPEDVFYTVQHGDSLASVAALLGVTVEDLRELNRIPEGGRLEAGQRLLIPFNLPPRDYPAPTPVTPAPQPEPLTTESPIEQIYRRMELPRAYWHTLWFDAELINYGPAGYVGPSKVYRVQLWSGGDQALVIGGPLVGAPDQVFLRNKDELYMANPGSSQPEFYEVQRETPLSSPLANNTSEIFSTMVNRSGFPAEPRLKVVGSAIQAGRETLILEQTNPAGDRVARLWIDTRSGLILLKQQFGGQDFKTLLKEFIVTGIAFDVQFPQELFDPQLPWRGGYALDPSGRPEANAGNRFSFGRDESHEQPFSPIQAPADFNPSRSHLVFKVSTGLDPSSAIAPVETRADLIAGDYFVGSLPLGDPFNLICDRSPDGRRIAFVSLPDRDLWPRPTFYWYDLADQSLHNPLPGIFISQFAFAPDSQRLAVFGAGSIYILDLERFEFTQLIKLSDAKSLVWSPDGQSLAFIARYSPGSQERIMVVDVHSGEVTFNTLASVQSSSSASPVKDWHVQFPEEMGGLEACASPPN